MSKNRQQRRAEMAMIPRGERGLTQSVIRNAEERGEQRGLQIGFASQELHSSVQYLAGMIDALDQLVIITQALPAAQQGQRMRIMISSTENLFGRTTLSKEQQLRLAAFDVRDALRDTDPYLAYSHSIFPLGRQHAENVAREGLVYADLIHDLMKPIAPELSEKKARAEINQRMKALSDYVRKKGGAAGEVIFQDMEQSTPKPGAKGGPSPAVKFILEQTNYYGKLHKLKTRGDKIEKLLSVLKERDDVKAWVAWLHEWQSETDKAKRSAINIDDHLKQCSVEVQAFARFANMDRSQKADALEDMEDNNKDWLRSKGG